MKNRLLTCYEEKEVIVSPFDNQIIEINDSILTLVAAYTPNKDVIIKARQIIIDQKINLNLFHNLSLISQGNIIFKSKGVITNDGSGSIYLKAGIENREEKGKVIFENTTSKQMVIKGDSQVHIYYNPEPNTNSKYLHKYHNPYKYSNHVEPKKAVISYMLVNNIEDLQGIKAYLHGNYALSQNIDASVTRNWNDGKGFEPLTIKENGDVQPISFSGNFDGNGFTISGLFINRPLESYVGLFGITAGYKTAYLDIKDLMLTDSMIIGDKYVGLVTGMAEYTAFNNIDVTNVNIRAQEIAGGILGTGQNIKLNSITYETVTVNAEESSGIIAGAVKEAEIYNGIYSCNIDDISPFEGPNCFGYVSQNSLLVTPLLEGDI